MRFAVITIELPLDGGVMEDAQVLAQLITEKALTTLGHVDLSKGFKPVGKVVDVRLENRPPGATGHARARSILDSQQ